MRIALDPESQQPAKENRKGVVEREANQFLNSVKESSENASSDIAFASLAILECEPTTASALKTATANSKSHLSLELKSQQQPVRILLQLALASMDRKELGRTIHWIHRYQNYSNSDLDNQLNAIVYIAEDCQSKNHFAAAEFIVEQFLSSKAGSGDELEYQVRAAKVIARLPNRSGESTALIKQVVERLRESDDSEWEAELPAIELIAAFYSGDAESLKIAQRLQEQHPDSGPLRTAIWNITQAMEANDDERLPAWRAGL
jgi:hypothetical protein